MKANFRKHKNYDNVYILNVNQRVVKKKWSKDEINIELKLRELLATQVLTDIICYMNKLDSLVEFVEDDFLINGKQKLGRYRIFIEKINEKDF